jgi:hypothetical protein
MLPAKDDLDFAHQWLLFSLILAAQICLCKAKGLPGPLENQDFAQECQYQFAGVSLLALLLWYPCSYM